MVSDVSVEVFFHDLTGRHIHGFSGRGGRHIVDVQGWTPGMHFYRLLIEGKSVSGKFMVE